MQDAPKKFVLVLKSRPRRFEFMELYELGFVVDWISTLEEAEHKLQYMQYDALFVDIESDISKINTVCARVHWHKPQLRIIFLKDPGCRIKGDHCGDVVMNNDASREELLAQIK